MENKIAVVTIIVENPDVVAELNEILHEFSESIIGRMGIPYRSKGINIICIAKTRHANGVRTHSPNSF